MVGSSRVILNPWCSSVSDYDSLAEFAASLEKTHPEGIDVFINNAGMVPGPTYKESKYNLELPFKLTVFLLC